MTDDKHRLCTSHEAHVTSDTDNFPLIRWNLFREIDQKSAAVCGKSHLGVGCYYLKLLTDGGCWTFGKLFELNTFVSYHGKDQPMCNGVLLSVQNLADKTTAVC